LPHALSTTCSWFFALRMRSIPYAVVLLLLTLGQPVWSVTFEGVNFAESYRVDGAALVLVGTGLQRYMVIYKVCVAGLYLPDGTRPASALNDVPKRLEIQYFHRIRAAQLAELTSKGVRDNTTAAEYARIRPQLDRFIAAYETVRPGDRYALTYRPGRGVTLTLNGVDKISVKGAEFSKALYSVWLGKRPVTQALKAGLLGGKR